MEHKFYIVEREDRARGWERVGYFTEHSAREVAREIRTFDGVPARTRPATKMRSAHGSLRGGK